MTNKNKIIFAVGVVIGALAVMGSVYAVASNVMDKPEEASTTVITTTEQPPSEVSNPEQGMAVTTFPVSSTAPLSTEKETTVAINTTQPETTTQGTTAPDLTGKVTKEQFKQIKFGMTYEEVIKITGCEPRSSVENDGKTECYWSAYAPESVMADPHMRVMFENGVVCDALYLAYKK